MKQYVVDAFTKEIFKGNPAAVCVLEKPLSNDIMQKIAIENNLSETAFILKEGENYGLRWFTPGGEISLCGHATLASAYVINKFIDKGRKNICFNTLSGTIPVEIEKDLISMDFPNFKLKPVEISNKIINSIGIKPLEVYVGQDTVCVLENEEQVKNVTPNLELIKQFDGPCFHITANGSKFDMVTRTFAPKCNVEEDPVCGRAHCHIASLWAKKLNKNILTAYQASRRGGILYLEYKKDKTAIKGYAALFSKAEITLNT